MPNAPQRMQLPLAPGYERYADTKVVRSRRVAVHRDDDVTSTNPRSGK